MEERPVARETQEEQYKRHQKQYRDARHQVFNIVLDKPSNLSNAIYKPLHGFFFDVNTSMAFRQRFFMGLAYIDLLQKKPYFVSLDRVIDIMSNFVFVAGQVLKGKSADFLSKSIEPRLDEVMVRSAINFLILIKIKKDRHDAIPLVLNLSDPSAKHTLFLYGRLEDCIGTHTRIVLSWIKEFKMEQFFKQNLHKFALACHIHELDVPKQLFTDKEIRKEVVKYLDKFACFNRPTPEGELEREFMNQFDFKAVGEKIFKYCMDADIPVQEFIPNTVAERMVLDYNHQMFQSKDEMEKLIVSYQALKEASPYPTSLKKMFVAVKRKNEDFANGAAYAMNFHKEVGIPPFDALMNVAQQRVIPHINFVKEKMAPSKLYIDKFSNDKCNIILVDTEEKYDQFLGWLAALQDVAFDIEACFVCQSSSTNQEAALMQLADNASPKCNVYLLDIYKLKNELKSILWLGFFGCFFRPRLKRIGFDVNNDVKFLQSAFPALKQYLAEKQPEFHDLKKVTEAVMNDSDMKRAVFGNNLPDSISLRNLVKCLLNSVMEKEERIGNWADRPLKKTQMEYAAKDAYFSMVCYKDIQTVIHMQYPDRDEYKAFMSQGIVIPKPVGDSTSERVEIPVSKKQVFDDVLKAVIEANKILGTENVCKPEDCLIVVDAPILKMVPTLRRCGYLTFDHRETTSDCPKNNEILTALSNFITEKFTPNSNLYFLSNRFPFNHDNFVANLRTKYIQVVQSQTDSSILVAVIEKTRAIIDVDNCITRCIKCYQNDTSFDFPIAAFRLAYRCYAKKKEFYDKKFKNEDPQEVDEKDRKALETFDKVFFEDGEKTMVVQDPELGNVYRFTIDGTVNTVKCPNGQTKEFKPETRLYEHDSLEFVRFCRNCAVFF